MEVEKSGHTWTGFPADRHQGLCWYVWGGSSHMEGGVETMMKQVE